MMTEGGGLSPLAKPFVLPQPESWVLDEVAAVHNLIVIAEQRNLSSNTGRNAVTIGAAPSSFREYSEGPSEMLL
jgi:hypothetical protein